MSAAELCRYCELDQGSHGAHNPDHPEWFNKCPVKQMPSGRKGMGTRFVERHTYFEAA